MPQSAVGLKHKYMYRQRGKILVRRKSVVIGTFKTAQEAARALAAHLDVDVRALPMRVSVGTESVKTKTTCHVRVGGVYENSGKFEVRAGGQYYGRYETSKKATAKLAEVRGGNAQLRKGRAGLQDATF